MLAKIRILPADAKARCISAILLAIFSTLPSVGCQSIHYYNQAVAGQMDILRSRQSISALVEDPGTPDALRQKLLFILSVRAFAENNLRLPVKDQYSSFVALNRPYVVWNVFAAPEFSLTPQTWCFPIAGCVAYRGYFSEQDADRFGNLLKQQGFDVYIGGAMAYSTLGWFADPVLSTFLDLNEPETAALIFHELAHSLLYVSGDTAFNESFATAVEQEGLRRWQAAAGDPAGYEKWLHKYCRRQKFIDLVSKYRRRLEDLYARSLPLNEKRDRKQILFAQMRSEFADLKSESNDLAAYDGWFNRPLNNAQVISVATYYNWLTAFDRILSETGGNLEKFYRQCRRLAKLEPAQRNRMLEDYQGASGGDEPAGAAND
jgi:predicted aminopeptidase